MRRSNKRLIDKLTLRKDRSGRRRFLHEQKRRGRVNAKGKLKPRLCTKRGRS